MLRVTLRLKQTRFGKLLYVPQDRFVGQSIEQFGEFSPQEGDLFAAICPGKVVVEVGANMGAHTLGISKVAKIVYAYEPQKLLAELVETQGVFNPDYCPVVVLNCAVGARTGTVKVPKLDYNQFNNYGGLGKEFWDANANGASLEVPLVKLDDQFAGGDPVDFLKVDVEGMEADVLRGGKEMILRDQPVLYVENDRPDKSVELMEVIQELGYKAYWHITPLFSPKNYDKNLVNGLGGDWVSFNLMCIPPKGAWFQLGSAVECTLANCKPEITGKVAGV